MHTWIIKSLFTYLYNSAYNKGSFETSRRKIKETNQKTNVFNPLANQLTSFHMIVGTGNYRVKHNKMISEIMQFHFQTFAQSWGNFLETSKPFDLWRLFSNCSTWLSFNVAAPQLASIVVWKSHKSEYIYYDVKLHPL